MDLVIQYAGDGYVDIGRAEPGVEVLTVFWPKRDDWPWPRPFERVSPGGERLLVDEAGPEETKWNHLARLEAVWFLIREARFVCFADDDVMRIGGTWRETFDLLAEVETLHGVDVGQCALTRDSFYSHPVTLVDPESEYRLTNFAEMMAPIMRGEKALEWREAFRDAGPVAWGVEALWSGKRAPCAILDRTPMRHMRQVRSEWHAGRFGRDPVEDRARYMSRWGLEIPEVEDFKTLARFPLKAGVGVPLPSH